MHFRGLQAIANHNQRLDRWAATSSTGRYFSRIVSLDRFPRQSAEDGQQDQARRG
jgi:hypothetical protein